MGDDETAAEGLRTQLGVLRRRLALTIALALTLAAAFLYEAWLRPPRLAETAGLIVRDDEGRVRAALVVRPAGPTLVFYDENGAVIDEVPAVRGRLAARAGAPEAP